MSGSIRKGVWVALAGLAVVLGGGGVSAQELPNEYKLFYADGIACPYCPELIEREFSNLGGVETVNVDLDNRLIIVSLGEGTELDALTARRVLESAGFVLLDFGKRDGHD